MVQAIRHAVATNVSIANAQAGDVPVDTKDRYVRSEARTLSALCNAPNIKHTVLFHALAQNGSVELDQLSPDQLADLVISKGSSYSVREKAFAILDSLMSDELDDNVLERIARNAPQKYRDWARNEMEGRKERNMRNSARRTYILPRIAAIIASYARYDQWDVWMSDPFNSGMFFTGEDLINIIKRARSSDNRREAVRRLEEKNRCETESRSLGRSPAANRILLECPDPHYWNTILTSGLSAYKERAAERLFSFAMRLPDSDRVRNVFERVMQEGSLQLKDRAARALLAFGISKLSITDLRYLTLYARGADRGRAINELRNREVTDPEQRKHIMSEIAQCSKIDPATICANARMPL